MKLSHRGLLAFASAQSQAILRMIRFLFLSFLTRDHGCRRNDLGKHKKQTRLVRKSVVLSMLEFNTLTTYFMSLPRSWLYEFGRRNCKSTKKTVTIGNRVFHIHVIQVRKFHEVMRARDSSTTLSLRMVWTLIRLNPCWRNQWPVGHLLEVMF